MKTYHSKIFFRPWHCEPLFVSYIFNRLNFQGFSFSTLGFAVLVFPTMTLADWQSKLPGGLKKDFESFKSASTVGGCQIDPIFLAAISRLESTGGTSSAARNKNNIMGIGMSGPLQFSSRKASVETAARSICGKLYRGRGTIEEIAEVYAPPCAPNDPKGGNKDWPKLIRQFYNELGGKESKVVSGNGDKKSPAVDYCSKKSAKTGKSTADRGSQARPSQRRSAAPSVAPQRSRQASRASSNRRQSQAWTMNWGAVQ